MGRDKARLRIGGQTMLARVRATAVSMRLPVRVIRRDAVPRCGPLGGIITAFRRTRADTVLFLACDMPFVPVEMIQRILRASDGGIRAVFAIVDGRSGFPFLIPRSTLALVEDQRARGEFSLQRLAGKLEAVALRVRASAVFNINTPEEMVLGARLAEKEIRERIKIRITKKIKRRRPRES